MVADALDRFDLAKRGDRILCALSGGGDSVCLTHVLAGLAQDRGFSVAAAHFSHGLRPESALAERQLCRKLCDSLSIPLFCGEGDTAAYAATHGLGIEEAARTLRKAFLEETAGAWQATAIATGHHLEDSAETLLFHLIRGAGGKGMQGIPPRNGIYIRPLIMDSKEEILAYLAENRLDYAQDPTNLNGDNARALMRRQVFPALTQLNGGAARHLARTALDNWLADETIRVEADELTSHVHHSGGEVSLPAELLLQASTEAAVRVLQIMQRKVGGHMLERPHIESILSLCRGSDPSAQTCLPGTRAIRRYEQLVLAPVSEPTALQPVSLWPEQPVAFGPWELRLTAQAGEGLALSVEQLPLTVRSRQTGDTLPMSYGTKTVKKLLIERKIPKDLRNTIPIVCDNKKILAVGGLCAAQQTGKTNYYIICRRKEI